MQVCPRCYHIVYRPCDDGDCKRTRLTTLPPLKRPAPQPAEGDGRCEIRSIVRNLARDGNGLRK